MTRREGADEDSKFFAGKSGLLLYRPAAPARYTPAAGYTFEWTGYLGSVADGIEITRFRMEELKATRVEAETAYDMKVVGKELGMFLNEIVA